jgi:hypothetical protein
MRLLQLMFAGLLAFFAVLVALAVFFGRLLRSSGKGGQFVRPRRTRDGNVDPTDDVIEVETTVVSTSQAER